MNLQDMKEAVATLVAVSGVVTITVEMVRVVDVPGQVLANPSLCAWALIAILVSNVSLAKEQ